MPSLSLGKTLPFWLGPPATRFGLILILCTVCGSDGVSRAAREFVLYTGDGSSVPTTDVDLLWAAVPDIPAPVGVIALPSRVCNYTIRALVMSVPSGDSTAPSVCSLAVPPFLVTQAALLRHPMPVKTEPFYTALGLSVPLLEWFLRSRPQVHTLAGLPRLAPAHNATQKRLLQRLIALGTRYHFRVLEEPSGDAAWLVCAMTRRRCDQDDPSAPPARGRPPCCAFLNKYVLFTLDHALNASRLQYFISDGTLLGAHRNRKIIPWDDDIDVLCVGCNAAFDGWERALQRRSSGVLFGNNRGVIMKVFFAQPWRVAGPVWPTSGLKRMPIRRVHQKLVFGDVLEPGPKYTPPTWPWKECEPIALEGRWFCGPRRPILVEYLTAKYGPEFMKPSGRW